jgi:hypothetical protein
MAQKKKKGKPPQSKQPKRKKLTASQIAFYAISVLAILAMILPYVLR